MVKLLLFITLITSFLAQEISTPEYVHAPAMMRFLVEDAKQNHLNNVYTIAILYSPEEEESVENKNRIMQAFTNEISSNRSGKVTIKLFPLAYGGKKSQLFADTDNNRVRAIYVCEELDEDWVRGIAFVGKMLSVLTFSGSNDLYEEGLSLTVKLNDNDMPEVSLKRSQFSLERSVGKTDSLSAVANLESPF